MPTDRTKITFWFDGVCSDDLGIVVSNFPVFSGAEPKVTTYSIPGRNGDLTRWDGTYKNVSADFKCYVADTSRVAEALTAINGWVSDAGYKKFVVSTEMGRYRMARITNAAEIGIRMGVIAPFTLKFDCKPQRFYEGEKPRVFGTNGTITNLTRFNALPLLRCTIVPQISSFAGAERISFNNALGKQVIILSASHLTAIPSYIDVDLESLTAVTDGGVNVPIYFEEGGYPKLCPGETTFSAYNSLAQSQWFSGIEILPRWWTL